ncbi:NAD-dependent epimerase/dehydratase family protein [Leptospira ilyithenensis]|uniref:NAD-dependent epimerase/dehydratase family protein n=1 Tax=Leptospira ilyithenensis TaxID=2484901 RepID=A0A4R9LKD0_9LEPT|nr:NAD-dependent epimerase/dehydratase family protein [Leptospira ilyithenensis]TGN08046.1 NAD-dependent epimerase/dehydratase family protein [Leptospira ilyithenensis]
MKTVLVTGGAGFLGSHLALRWKEENPNDKIIAFDNLKRRGSELNISRLRSKGIEFFHGDIRIKEDLFALPKIDLILECSAEPSVMAGINSSPDYLIQTNLIGTLNCLELARRDKSDFVFFSTSRVYPIESLNQADWKESETRFEWNDKQKLSGVSSLGITESFPLEKPRSLYGSTKLASELIIQEYGDTYGLRTLINRCGVLTGPWQMGKIDQGVVVFWLASHVYKRNLKYFGYGGKGKQVRDLLHVEDLYALLKLQIGSWELSNGQTFNVGGGREVSVSLLELTDICQKITGNKIEIESVLEDRQADIRIYLSDCTKVKNTFGWRPKYDPETILKEIHIWIQENSLILANIL